MESLAGSCGYITSGEFQLPRETINIHDIAITGKNIAAIAPLMAVRGEINLDKVGEGKMKNTDPVWRLIHAIFISEKLATPGIPDGIVLRFLHPETVFFLPRRTRIHWITVIFSDEWQMKEKKHQVEREKNYHSDAICFLMREVPRGKTRVGGGRYNRLPLFDNGKYCSQSISSFFSLVFSLARFFFFFFFPLCLHSVAIFFFFSTFLPEKLGLFISTVARDWI